MRLAVLSDIHGHLVALNAVLSDLDTQAPFDAIGVAGDLVEGGPQPRETLARLRALHCPIVQGNTDRYLITADDILHGLGKGRSSIEGMRWTRSQLDGDDLAYLASLPFSHAFAGPRDQDVLMVHANLRDQETHLRIDLPTERVAELLAGVGTPAVVFGHLHIPYVRRVAGRLLVDAASVGEPRDGDLRAAYAILEWTGEGWDAAIRRVEYDREATIAAFRASSMPDVEKRIATWLRASYE